MGENVMKSSGCALCSRFGWECPDVQQPTVRLTTVDDARGRLEDIERQLQDALRRLDRLAETPTPIPSLVQYRAAVRRTAAKLSIALAQLDEARDFLAMEPGA